MNLLTPELARNQQFSPIGWEGRTLAESERVFVTTGRYWGTERLSLKEFVSEILKAKHLMVELINDVLDLEKIESGQMPLHIKESPLEPLLDSCLTMISANARAMNIELVTEFSVKELPPVRVDETRFRQVLLNLLSNAVKYNNPEERVVLNCETTGDGMVRISVTDTGQGIPAEQKDLVFEPFERLGSEIHALQLQVSASPLPGNCIDGIIAVRTEVATTLYPPHLKGRPSIQGRN